MRDEEKPYAISPLGIVVALAILGLGAYQMFSGNDPQSELPRSWTDTLPRSKRPARSLPSEETKIVERWLAMTEDEFLRKEAQLTPQERQRLKRLILQYERERR